MAKRAPPSLPNPSPNGAMSFLLSAHAWLIAGLCLLPLLIWLPLWLLDAGREPGNGTAHESGTDDEEPDSLLAAA